MMNIKPVNSVHNSAGARARRLSQAFAMSTGLQ